MALRSSFNLDSLSTLLQNNRFKEIFVDVNIRKPYFSEKTLRFALTNATILKISYEELQTVLDTLELSSDYVSEVRKQYKNIRILIITKGGDGAELYDMNSNRIYKCEAPRIKVASSVGAGDSFSAAFLYKYAISSDLQDSIDLAAKISAFVVSRIEAVPKYTINNFGLE